VAVGLRHLLRKGDTGRAKQRRAQNMDLDREVLNTGSRSGRFLKSEIDSESLQTKGQEGDFSG